MSESALLDTLVRQRIAFLVHQGVPVDLRAVAASVVTELVNRAAQEPEALAALLTCAQAGLEACIPDDAAERSA